MMGVYGLEKLTGRVSLRSQEGFEGSTKPEWNYGEKVDPNSSVAVLQMLESVRNILEMIGACLERNLNSMESNMTAMRRKIIPIVNAESPCVQLSELEFATLSVLEKNGVKTVGKLISLSALELEAFKGIGPIRLNEIREALKEHHLELSRTCVLPGMASLSKMDTRIEDLGLSVRAYSCLCERQKLHTLGDIAKVPASELLKTRNCGVRTLAEIEIMLEQFGIVLDRRSLDRTAVLRVDRHKQRIRVELKHEVSETG